MFYDYIYPTTILHIQSFRNFIIRVLQPIPSIVPLIFTSKHLIVAGIQLLIHMGKPWKVLTRPHIGPIHNPQLDSVEWSNCWFLNTMNYLFGCSIYLPYIYHLPNVISPAFNQLNDLKKSEKKCARRRGALLCKAWAEIRPFQDANEDLLTNDRLHLLRWCGREKKHVFAGKNCWDNQDHPIWSNSTWSKCMKMVWVGEIIPSPYY